MHILIIDDEKNICSSLSGFLNDMGHSTKTCMDGDSGLQTAIAEYFDLVFLDVMLPGKNGLEVLEQLRQAKPNQHVVMISGDADLQTAVRATKLGAYNFLEKPLNPDKVILEVKNIDRHQKMIREVTDLKKLVEYEYTMVGNSPALEKVRNEIKRAAPSDGRIMIYGDNGTGKELVAREIHLQSNRKNGPFIKVNCAAIPKDLIESELFGHEKGAFTGAIKKKCGMFQEADGGTLLLDEVGDLSLESQAKLLRVLQENEFMRVGGTSPIQFNTRIISATNKNLAEEINKSSFREDLYFRLTVIPITVPALKERKEDIPMLAKHFLTTYSLKNGKRQMNISDKALEPMISYSWPGNIRELKNFIERLVIMSDSDEIDHQQVLNIFPESFNHHYLSSQGNDEVVEKNLSLKEHLEIFEKELLTKEFIKAEKNVSRMAEALKTDRPNLHRKLKKFGIKT
ncbi:sigma-54-dependent Fis family transcriptional regulator [candidate division KSB1 bacterium]|nr:sigma-54-dependent Fis family transcriptional regulator [candidate division KSB1 bacterium]MBL7095486.1 sigma-54-dependent Fis family transcriptional regulator [candidate division KSB1 bacterium]